MSSSCCAASAMVSSSRRMAFGGCGAELLVELRDALFLTGSEETGGLLEVGVGVAAALFKARERGGGGAGQLVAALRG